MHFVNEFEFMACLIRRGRAKRRRNASIKFSSAASPQSCCGLHCPSSASSGLRASSRTQNFAVVSEVRVTNERLRRGGDAVVSSVAFVGGRRFTNSDRSHENALFRFLTRETNPRSKNCSLGCGQTDRLRFLPHY